MRNIKCSDCAEYRNEWCEKIVDSPYPDMLRDCQYWHERKDMVEVIRCKDCKHRYIENMTWHCPFGLMGGEDFFCGYGSLGRAERRSDE